MANMDSVKMKELSDLLDIKLSNMEQLWHRGYNRPEKFAGIDILDLIEVIGFKEARIALPKIESAFDEGLIEQAVRERIEEDTQWKKPGIGGLFAKTKKLHLRGEKKEGETEETPVEEGEPEEARAEIKEKSGLGLNKLKSGFSIHRKKEEVANGDAEVNTKPGIGLARFKDKITRKKGDEDEQKEGGKPDAEEEPAVEEQQKKEDIPKEEPGDADETELVEEPEKVPEESPEEDKDNEELPEEKPEDEPAKEEDSEGAPKKSMKSTE